MSTAVRPTPARTGVWAGIGAVVMSFAAYTSAMVVRLGSGGTVPAIRLPAILYVNTAILLASSVTLAEASRRVRRLVDHPDWTGAAQASAHRSALALLFATLTLGLLFLAGQILAWHDLARQGLFLATNSSSSFFYVLTAVHGLHVVGGLAALAYVLRRAILDAGPAPAGALGAVALYWHFMDVLWLYVLLLLVIWL